MSVITILCWKEKEYLFQAFIEKGLNSCSCWNSVLFPENKERNQGQNRKRWGT